MGSLLGLQRPAPALLGSLTGYAKPGADFRPGIACVAEAVDGSLNRIVDVVGQTDQVAERFDVAGCDAATVGAQDAAGEGGVLGVLGDRASAFWCQDIVDSAFNGTIGGLSLAGLSGVGGHGVSWPRGVPSGGLHPMGADHRLERELSRAWSRRDFQDALAESNHRQPSASLMQERCGQRILEPLTGRVEG